MKKIFDILIPTIYFVITISTYSTGLTISSYDSDEVTAGSSIDSSFSYNDKTLSGLKIFELSCKSPCPSTAEMCIQMCE